MHEGQSGDEVPPSSERSSNAPSSALSNEMLLAHYRSLTDDHRELDRQIYQIPAVLATISSVILISSFYYLTGLPRGLMLLIGFGLSFSLTIVLGKQRYGEDLRSIWMKEIEQKYAGRPFPASTNDVTLVDVERQFKYKAPIPRWFIRQRGFHYIFGLCLFIAFVFALLALITFVAIL